MKIKENELRKMIREELVRQLPADNFEDNGIDWPEDAPTEEDEIYKVLMSLCSEGESSFRQMYEELTSNPYIVQNPEKFERLSQKIKSLCDTIETIWDD